MKTVWFGDVKIYKPILRPMTERSYRVQCPFYFLGFVRHATQTRVNSCVISMNNQLETYDIGKVIDEEKTQVQEQDYEDFGINDILTRSVLVQYDYYYTISLERLD